MLPKYRTLTNPLSSALAPNGEDGLGGRREWAGIAAPRHELMPLLCHMPHGTLYKKVDKHDGMVIRNDKRECIGMMV
jgi:hypothetical protein